VHHPTIPTLPRADHSATVRSFGMLSTFPPTACGIATFAAALSAGLVALGATVDVVRCGLAPDLEDPLVVAAVGDGAPARLAECVAALNATDVVIVQHEYGIYDGADGEAVLDLMSGVTSPMVLVAHTVVSEPTARQRSVLTRACAMADVVVVMTETARARLGVWFGVDDDSVMVVPHGAATPPAVSPTAIGSVAESSGAPSGGRHVLTWGLLGPGKGIEWAIDAFGRLDDLDPPATYTIAGATHPKVRARTGESYREMLVERAARTGAGMRITFDDSYRDLEALTELVRSADLVVLPYDSVDQVTSGVLVDAVAAGRPVVSTAFPHAAELLATGAGTVVPQRDPAALAAAIRDVLTHPDRAQAMAAEARRLAPTLAWTAVAGRYDAIATDLLADRLTGGAVRA
jgi:glycosyltransferase involved in cell wall biosynthesis